MLLRLVIWCAVAAAHPMGSFSANHYARIEVGTAVRVTYVLDLGEVPAYSVLKEGKDADTLAREWIRGLEFRSGSRILTPRLVSAERKIAEGSGGLKTARFTMRMTVEGADGSLEFEDRNFPERAGWKEIIIRAQEGVALVHVSEGSTDRSKELTDYAGTAPQDLRARVEWRAGDARVAPAIVAIPQPKTVPEEAGGADEPRGEPAKKDYLSELLGRSEIGLGLMLLGMAAAFGLGAMHALSPGHGKTIVAAYLVGSRGTMRHAAILGATVTFTHTASVFALGIASLFLSEYVAPQKIAPVLGGISGISIVVVGGWLVWKRWGALRHSLAHEHGVAHHHHAHDDLHGDEHTYHDDSRQDRLSYALNGHEDTHHGDSRQDRLSYPLHGHEDTHHGDSRQDRLSYPLHTHRHLPEGEITMGNLLALGASGGLVPCPTALVLLLSAIALGRVGLGMMLLVAFSLGLAGVLMGIGMMVLYAKQWLPDPAASSRHAVLRWAPVGSAVVIVGVGLVMTWVALR